MSIPSTRPSLLCDLVRASHRDEAWAVFHARYRGVTLRWCLRRGLPADGAEGLTPEVLLKLFRRLPQYQHDPGPGQFRAWLKVVVNNAPTDFGRQRRSARRPHRPDHRTGP